MVPLLQKSYEGGLTFADFWQPHHGHRLVLSRIIILFLAKLSGWNTLYEVILNVILALGIFGVIVSQIKHSFGKKTVFLLLPIISLLIFSLNQFENWLLGFTMHIFLHVLAVVLGIRLLSSKPLTQKHLAGAIICGLFAITTFATGLLFWWIGLMLILVHPNSKYSYRKNEYIGWIAFSIVTTFIYMYGFTSETQSFWLQNIAQIPNTLLFTLMYLGRPVTLFLYLDTTWGIIVSLYVIITTFTFLFYLYRKQKLFYLYPFIAYLLYALGGAVVTAIGRGHLGVEAARPSRYITVSNLFWVGAVVIWYVFYKEIKINRKSVFLIKSLPLIFGVFVVIVSLSSYYSIELFHTYSQRFKEERDSVLEYARSGKLTVYYHNAAIMKQRIEVLRKYKLSVFRE